VVEQLRRAIVYLRQELDQTRLRMAGLESKVSDLEELLTLIPVDLGRVATKTPRVGVVGTPPVPNGTPAIDSGIANPATKTGERGEAFLARLAMDGTLVSSESLSTTWAVTKQALHLAVRRGDLFSVKVAGRRLYLSAFMQLERDVVAEVCQLLRHLSVSEQLVFWLRPHGALRGATVAVALEAGQRKLVMQVAEGWVEEKALADVDS
jgi:hypothetical protein